MGINDLLEVFAHIDSKKLKDKLHSFLIQLIEADDDTRQSYKELLASFKEELLSCNENNTQQTKTYYSKESLSIILNLPIETVRNIIKKYNIEPLYDFDEFRKYYTRTK